MRYAMVIDTKKCVGCCDCVVACKTENKVEKGLSRCWVTQREEGKFPDVSVELRSERCNQCDNSPCVRCCPTGASHYSKGGIVSVNPDKCIGCSACIQSCPYNARFTNPEGYVEKCTFCEHRVAEGLMPACTSVCPARCFTFGDLDNPKSMVSQVLKKRKHKVLKHEAGTVPKIYYLV